MSQEAYSLPVIIQTLILETLFLNPGACMKTIFDCDVLYDFNFNRTASK